MIKRLTTAEEVTKLLQIPEDPHLPCSKGEWVQWLVKASQSPKVWICAVFGEEENLTGYMVAYNAVSPPLSDQVNIIKAFFQKNVEVDEEMLELLIEWAKECGAKRIVATAEKTYQNSFLPEMYGFEETGQVKIQKFL